MVGCPRKVSTLTMLKGQYLMSQVDSYVSKLLLRHFGCNAGDHTVPHEEHISLLRATQHAVCFWKDDGCNLRFVSDCQLVADSWKRGKEPHWFADFLATSLRFVGQEVCGPMERAQGGCASIAC